MDNKRNDTATIEVGTSSVCRESGKTTQLLKAMGKKDMVAIEGLIIRTDLFFHCIQILR